MAGGEDGEEGGVGKYVRKVMLPTRYQPADGRVAGTFCLSEPGQMTLTLDNTHAALATKTVRLTVRDPSPIHDSSYDRLLVKEAGSE